MRFIETPEGVELGLRLAGPIPRALALVLDLIIRVGLYLAFTPLLMLADVGLGLVLLAFFVLEWFYPVLFEVMKGATPGKAAMGLVVVHDNGTPVGLAASMLRNLLRVVDFLPLLYGIGLVSMLMDRDFRRLGDLAAGTLVLHAEGSAQPRTIPEARPVKPPSGLRLETRQAILSFAERSHRLSAPRRIELAEILTADSGARGEQAVDCVKGWANWLARGRGLDSAT